MCRFSRAALAFEVILLLLFVASHDDGDDDDDFDVGVGFYTYILYIRVAATFLVRINSRSLLHDILRVVHVTCTI